MNIQIKIDPLVRLENQYKEILEKKTESYPTLADFDVKTPLEILEKYPILPCLLTSFKIDEKRYITPFLKLQKPIVNLPENAQKELIRYIRELTVNFVPIYGMGKDLTGTNAHARTGPILNGIGFYIRDIGNILIKQLELGFTEEEIVCCEKCGDPKCHPYTAICAHCHFPHFSCDNKANRHNTDMTCNLCGDTHATCLVHVRLPDQKTCTVYKRKSSVPASPPFEIGEIITVETRRLLRRLKRGARDILKEIHHQFPILVDFHTRHPDTFLEQYPIVPATITVLKESETNPMLFHQMQSDAKVAGSKLISAIRDITAAEWGDTLADTSTNALIEHFKLKCTLDEIDTCSKCGEKTCNGDMGLCYDSKVDGTNVQGCEQQHFRCQQEHYAILTCENPECLRVNEVYRQCIGHTCIFPKTNL